MAITFLPPRTPQRQYVFADVGAKCFSGEKPLEKAGSLLTL